MMIYLREFLCGFSSWRKRPKCDLAEPPLLRIGDFIERASSDANSSETMDIS
jgi:hypothetical protein